MRWWVSSRRPCLVALGLVGFVAGVVAFGTRVVPTPGLLGEFLSPVPLSVYLPLAGVAVVAVSISNVPSDLEASAVRRVHLLDAASVLVFMCLATLACGAASMAWGGRAPLEGARNLGGYVGLGLLALTRFGPRASSFVPAAFAVSASTFGWRSATRTARWWAWPLEPAGTTRSAALAAGLLAAGIVVLALRGRRRPVGQNS